ncbi:34754_t:CDS:2, partial [Racocetra persica]
EQSSQNSNRYIPEQIVLSQRESNVNIPNPIIRPAGTSSKSLENNIPTSNISDNTSSDEQDLMQEISTSIKEQAQSIISPEINHTIKISENN